MLIPGARAAPDRSMRIDSGLSAVAADQLQEPVDKIAQFLRRDGCVFDKGERLGILLHRHGEAKRCLTQAPDTRLLRGFRGVMESVTVAMRCEFRFERGESGGRSAFVSA